MKEAFMPPIEQPLATVLSSRRARGHEGVAEALEDGVLGAAERLDRTHR